MRRPVALVAVLLGLASCGVGGQGSGGAGPPAPISVPKPAHTRDAAAARLLATGATFVAIAPSSSLDVHVRPGTERPYMHLDTVNPWGQRLRLLVVKGAADEDGDLWLRIRLPIWPNGQEGWVSASDVRLAEERELLVVDLSGRLLTRMRDGKVVDRMPVAIGTATTPTPPGRYYVWAKVTTGRPAGPYGSFALGLSGFSDAIRPWDGWPGEPRLAIHGTDDPSEAGRAVSHGCVRVLNRLLRRLRDVPMGTPVEIRL